MKSQKLHAIRQAFQARKDANAAIVAARTAEAHQAALARRAKADEALRSLGVGGTRS